MFKNQYRNSKKINKKIVRNVHFTKINLKVYFLPLTIFRVVSIASLKNDNELFSQKSNNNKKKLFNEQ